jgi:4-hydroxy-tetrahydrodipicolinate synthase
VTIGYQDGIIVEEPAIGSRRSGEGSDMTVPGPALSGQRDRVVGALGGISGVHVTPYGADGAIAFDVLARLVRRIADAGIHNIVTGGNTGEFFALTADEVERLQAAAIAAVDGRTVVTAAVGRSLPEAIATGRAARRVGADAVMVHHPADPFAAPRAQVDYFIAIAEALDLPVLAYVRSDAIALADLVRLATHPNVVGVKFAAPNVMLLAECIRATSGGSANWICGLAEGWAIPFYALGTRGFTSGLVNVDPARALAIWSRLEAGDFAVARELVAAIAPFEALRARHANGANVTVVKTALEILGWRMGPVRRPGLPSLERGERDALRAILDGWGLQAATTREVAE